MHFNLAVQGLGVNLFYLYHGWDKFAQITAGIDMNNTCTVIIQFVYRS